MPKPLEFLQQLEKDKCLGVWYEGVEIKQGLTWGGKIKNQGRNAIRLIGIHTGERPDLQLGKVHPEFKPSRPSTRSTLANSSLHKRISKPSLTEPLQIRHQTFLSYQLNSDVRRQLTSGIAYRENEGRRSKGSILLP